ncbi:hypothetical protein TNCV_27761 [Trichonephila clavipes]|uniref:Uncharacterized protein n=1 Tax=Trichonephila clavipes TaxID=2585209 RepID=A0A8X7BLM4_TRICX|nr:hypothetical protein TNCV_27761 [Trichonephila clavipes]
MELILLPIEAESSFGSTATTCWNNSNKQTRSRCIIWPDLGQQTISLMVSQCIAIYWCPPAPVVMKIVGDDGYFQEVPVKSEHRYTLPR